MKNPQSYPAHSYFESIKAGDATTFKVIHDKYKARLLYYGYRLVNDWNEAEDMVSEAFLALWNNRQLIQSDDHIKNFLFLAIRNKASDHNSVNERRRQILQTLPIAAPSEQEDIYDIKQMEEQIMHILSQAITALPKECLKIFELSWKEEKSPAEIAAIMNINPATVRSQKRRAIQLIQIWIKNKAPEMLGIIGMLWGSQEILRKIIVYFLHDLATRS